MPRFETHHFQMRMRVTFVINLLVFHSSLFQRFTFSSGNSTTDRAPTIMRLNLVSFKNIVNWSVGLTFNKTQTHLFHTDDIFFCPVVSSYIDKKKTKPNMRYFECWKHVQFVHTFNLTEIMRKQLHLWPKEIWCRVGVQISNKHLKNPRKPFQKPK